MRFVKSVFNRFLGFLCSLFGLPFLYSCDEGLGIFVTEGVAAYGMPPNWGYISGTVTGDSNGDGTATPLANVKIYADTENTVYSADESGLVSITNDRGKFHIDLYKEGTYTFRFEDGDGSENGSFKAQEKTISWKNSERLENQDITLERDDSNSLEHK